MKRISIFFLLLTLLTTLIGCSEPPQLQHLEGYWEIEKVDIPEQGTKEYSISTTLDHYQLHSDSTGAKTKVNPQLDGTFITSGHQENFSIEIKGDVILLHYNTPLTSYSEKVVQLKPESLILLNDRNMKYTYKRFKKIELE
ncbi:hypothetical protein E7Z59_12345 [Robertkochia marina]|uniref:Lipocalin-like domain-containing protein n=1 Tax=Robertkochia marina TaxID=1227945 RepID=A0A4S3M0P3_9FLAO|nr:lipocalin family protein [Robertkochia marina]THD66577.1 hypothetical protein E7Z59_12345 [Robertkochia marina]TRZ45584.1 hypothetical protein D3A96_06285 [Robertkochia marina]